MSIFKRLFITVFAVLFVGASTYFIMVNIFAGLKIKGYNYLFRETEPYDLVIKHVMILDGTGENDAFRGDIAIRDGQVAGVGYIIPKESVVFDGGGLTVIPWPLEIEKGGPAVEHLLRNSYPRYSAEEIFLQEEPYKGLSLAEAACLNEVTIDQMFDILKNSEPFNSKVLLVSLAQKKEESAKEMLARLTSYRAHLYGRSDRGAVKEGCLADFYIFKTSDYMEEELLRLFKKGSIPEPVYRIKEGEFLNL